MSEYHCEYCYCPKEEWKPCLKSYHGDECKLYAAFQDLIEDGISESKLRILALNQLSKEIDDIPDLNATVEELIQIVKECGVI